jgi:hypothetical protein
MGKTIRVPEPVYSKATTQAEREDVSRGAIIRDWMEKAEKFEEVSRR